MLCHELSVFVRPAAAAPQRPQRTGIRVRGMELQKAAVDTPRPVTSHTEEERGVWTVFGAFIAALVLQLGIGILAAVYVAVDFLQSQGRPPKTPELASAVQAFAASPVGLVSTSAAITLLILGLSCPGGDADGNRHDPRGECSYEPFSALASALIDDSGPCRVKL